MEIPDYLTCVVRNLCEGQEATVRTGHDTTDWSQIGKGVRQGCILSLCLFNLYAEYIMLCMYVCISYIIWNSGLDDSQAGINTARRSTNNLRNANNTTPMAENKKELKNSWWRWKRRVKTWLKTQHSKNLNHGIWSHHFMANRWGKSGNSGKLYFFGLQNHCRW